MPYPEEWVKPAREELTKLGFKELRTREDVDQTFTNPHGTVLIVVNSICGCAAGSARPALAEALNIAPRPALLTTVFAGQDLDATQRAREYLSPQPPSSPSVALWKDGKLVFMLHRHQIEGRSPEAITRDLRAAFEIYCAD